MQPFTGGLPRLPLTTDGQDGQPPDPLSPMRGGDTAGPQ